MLNTNKKIIKFFKKNLIISSALLILLIFLIIFYFLTKPQAPAEIITNSTLEKIINVSELSTFEAIYVGVAEVNNEDNPEKLDYYVYYESKVKAGIDFEKILLEVNHEEKIIKLTLPTIEITDIAVNIASLDYIFENNKANTNTVSEQAYKACIDDVSKESSEEAAIYELAHQNAINIITALLSPFIEQLDEEYTIDII